MIETDTAVKMTVRSLFDAIQARKQVRELARSMGFDLAEQASVSLAAWSLLGHLGVGATCQGELVVNSITNGSNKGISIICTAGKNANSSLSDIHLKMHLIVDELKINAENVNQINVSFVKWKV